MAQLTANGSASFEDRADFDVTKSSASRAWSCPPSGINIKRSAMRPPPDGYDSSSMA
jgi:hypothetical protein